MKMMFAAAALAATALVPGSVPGCGSAMAFACCKTCKAGKACGDSCIAKDAVCNKPRGCACNG